MLIITARKRSLGQGNIFAPVCHSVHRGSASVHAGIHPPAKETTHPRRPPSRPTPRGEIEGDQVQAHTQGGNWGGSDPGPHPRGKLRGIRSRPTPKGEIQGDQVLANIQVGNSGRSGAEPPPRRLLLRAVRILLECILVSWISNTSWIWWEFTSVAMKSIWFECQHWSTLWIHNVRGRFK